MQRRKPKKTAATKRRPRKKQVLPPMPMVLVDSSRLRQEMKEEYDEVVRDLSKARAELDHFHQQDIPKFSRWVSTQFGALLTEIRETSQRLHENQLLLFEIEREVMYSGISHIGAYERIMERRRKQQAAPEEAADDGPAEEDPSDFDFESKAGERAFHNAEDFDAAKQNRHGSLSEPALGRLKELYRALVRRLHPDTQKQMTPQKMEWWHQAQAAYQAGDAHQLEVILSLCEIEEAGTSEKTNLSVLKRIIQQFRSSLRQIQQQIFRCRRDPAWQFSKRREIENLKKEIGRKLNQDLRVIQEELRWIEQQLAVWSRQAEQIRRPVYYRRRRNPMGFY